MVERNLIDPKQFMKNGQSLIEFHDVHQKKYIDYLEKQLTNSKLEVSQLRQIIHQHKNQTNFSDNVSEEPSNFTTITRQPGKPSIDAVSTVSFDFQAAKRQSILDSEVKGMDRFCKVNVPVSHVLSGRGK